MAVELVAGRVPYSGQRVVVMGMELVWISEADAEKVLMPYSKSPYLSEVALASFDHNRGNRCPVERRTACG